MKRLQEHLNSNYIELASRLRPKDTPRKVVAYVESYDDVFFWRSGYPAFLHNCHQNYLQYQKQMENFGYNFQFVPIVYL